MGSGEAGAGPPVLSQQGVELMESIKKALERFNEQGDGIKKEIADLRVESANLSGDIKGAREATDRNSIKLDRLETSVTNKLDILSNRATSTETSIATLAVKSNINLIVSAGGVLAIVLAAFNIFNAINNAYRGAPAPAATPKVQGPETGALAPAPQSPTRGQ